MKMINRIFILPILFFVGCSNAHTSNIIDDFKSENSNKDSLQSESGEDFLIFLETFSSSPEYQKTRVKFPFQDCYLTTKGKDTCSFIAENSWRHLQFLDTGACYKSSVYLMFDSFKKSELQNTNERVFAFVGIENEVSMYYYFKRMNGKWFLIKRKDFSYSDE